MFKWRICVGGQSYNPWVAIGLVVLSVLLGVVNNCRVHPEQRVPWFGETEETEAF